MYIHTEPHTEHIALPLCRPVSEKWVGELLLFIGSIMRRNTNFMAKNEEFNVNPGGHIVVS